MRVLAVVAHPDDEVLGPGGTLLRHVDEGDEVRVLIVCSVLDEALRMTPSRLEDAQAVADDAGWDLTWGGLATLALDVAEVTALIEVHLADVDLVYTHHRDLNRDHRLVHEATVVAARPWTTTVRAIRTFETPSASEWGEPFIPDYFVGIYLDAKTALLSHYASELRSVPHPRSVANVSSHAAFWGASVGYAAAEPFRTLWERR